jgi:hypothetical protein
MVIVDAHLPPTSTANDKPLKQTRPFPGWTSMIGALAHSIGSELTEVFLILFHRKITGMRLLLKGDPLGSWAPGQDSTTIGKAALPGCAEKVDSCIPRIAE